MIWGGFWEEFRAPRGELRTVAHGEFPAGCLPPLSGAPVLEPVSLRREAGAGPGAAYAGAKAFMLDQAEARSGRGEVNREPARKLGRGCPDQRSNPETNPVRGPKPSLKHCFEQLRAPNRRNCGWYYGRVDKSSPRSQKRDPSTGSGRALRHPCLDDRHSKIIRSGYESVLHQWPPYPDCNPSGG
jgi:hypothetical protein